MHSREAERKPNVQVRRPGTWPGPMWTLSDKAKLSLTLCFALAVTPSLQPSAGYKLGSTLLHFFITDTALYRHADVHRIFRTDIHVALTIVSSLVYVHISGTAAAREACFC